MSSDIVALDFLGHTMELNDEVVYNRKNYRGLTRGFIAKITPKMVFLVSQIGDDKERGEDYPENLKYHIKQNHREVISLTAIGAATNSMGKGRLI